MLPQDLNHRALVIGLGNLLGGDDAFGVRVIEYLRQHPPRYLDPSDIVDGSTDLLGWFDRFTGYDRVILADALLDPTEKFGRPGEIVILEHDALMSLAEGAPAVHHISPLYAVQLFPRLHPEAETRFTVVGLCTDQVRTGTPTWLTETAIDHAATLIHTICEI